MENRFSKKPASASRKCTPHSHIRYRNATPRRVDVIWINYDGVRVKYRTLEPTEYFDVTAFVTHPWVFFDSETHAQLTTSSGFDAEESSATFLKEPRPGLTTMAHVNITLPMYSLMECSLQRIQKCLRNPDDAFQLEIPSFLQHDLQHRCYLTLANKSE